MDTYGKLDDLPQYHEFAPQIEIYCARILSDSECARDLVHETFIRFMENGPERKGNLRAWLYRVARNLCIDYLRRDSRYVSLDDTQLLYARSGDDPAEAAYRKEEREVMVDNMRKLPPKQQEVLRLKFQEDMTYAQIAEVTGETVANVGWLLHEAIRALRGKMVAAK